jgi:suppressor for copper-sensitivity B
MRDVKAWLLALLLLSGVAEARAGGSAWVETPETRVRLLAAAAAVGEAETLALGLEIELAPGWKTYWRSPGEAGSPPHLDWGGSRNLAAAELAWPAPERILAFDLESFGYADRVLLPILVRAAEPGAPLRARLKLDYQVCKDVCIPVFAELALDLPAGPANSTAHAPAIDRAQAQVPRANGEAGIAIAAPRLVDGDDGPALLIEVTAPTPLLEAMLIVEGALPLGRAERLDEAPTGARFRVPLGAGADTASLPGRELTLTLVAGAAAREARLAIRR